MESEKQIEYLNLIIQEYNRRLALLEHEVIVLRVENTQYLRIIEELKNSREDNQTQV